MHRPSTVLIAACLLAACSPAPESEEVAVQTPVQPAPEAERPAGAAPDPVVAATGLTIYSGDYAELARASDGGPSMPGYALVQRPLKYSLAEGANAVTVGVPGTMDVEAAVLRAERPDLAITGQKYTPALSGTREVLAQAVGRRIAVEHTAGGARQTDSGTLVSTDDGLVVALGDGRLKVIRNYDNFSIIDSGSMPPQQPNLRWNIQSPDAGDAAFVLTYPMTGLAWRAEYVARLLPGESCRLSLEGAALVANRSGQGFPQARLTLVAGEPRRVQVQARFPPAAAAPAAYMAADAEEASLPVQGNSAEYRAYRLPEPVRIEDGAIERLPLFAAQPEVACERAYVVDADAHRWQPPQPMIEPAFHGSTGDLPVSVAVSLQNTAEAGLGQALPEGRMRVFDGDEFLGESRIGHTAQGEEIRLEVGTAFELSAEREATAFELDRSGRTITESFAITLRNARTDDVVVRVVEPLPRWTQWEITRSSVLSEKTDASHARFDVPVPAGGDAQLTYTVRYQWPRGVAP